MLGSVGARRSLRWWRSHTLRGVSKLESSPPPQMNPPVRREPRPPTVSGLLLAAVKENWRRLRTMSTALWLLGVLAVESIIATIVPQEVNVPQTVAEWRTGEAGPGTAVSETLDLIGAYDMYASPLFLMTLLLLFTSLTACLIPRIRGWWRITRRSVPPLTRHLGDQEHVQEIITDLEPEAAHATVRGELADRGYRTRDGAADDRGRTQVAAEKGVVVREGGSLLFHLSFYVLLVAIILGQLLTFEGFVGVTEGETFTDTEIGYWIAEPGRWFGSEDHSGFQLTNDDFRVEWFRDPEFGGTPRVFEADVTIETADGDTRTAMVKGNNPIVVDGFKIHLLGWGYAPRVVVREGNEVVFDGFITTTVNDTGAFRGAVKAPAAEPDVGLDLFLIPYAPDGDDGQPVITGAPWADAPLLAFRSYAGDLQLSAAQNVNTLNTELLTEGPRGGLRPGQIVQLPGSDVSVEFAELRQWTNFQVSRRPQVPWLLLGAGLLLIGLLPALYAYRRRVWVGVERSPDGRTLVVVAGRSFQRQQAFEGEFDELAGDLRAALDAPDLTPAPRDEVAPR